MTRCQKCHLESESVTACEKQDKLIRFYGILMANYRSGSRPGEMTLDEVNKAAKVTDEARAALTRARGAKITEHKEPDMNGEGWTVWIDGTKASGPAVSGIATDIGEFPGVGVLFANKADAIRWCQYLNESSLNARVTWAKITEHKEPERG